MMSPVPDENQAAFSQSQRAALCPFKPDHLYMSSHMFGSSVAQPSKGFVPLLSAITPVNTNSLLPVRSGSLSHSFAQGQLQLHLNTGLKDVFRQC